MMKNSLVTDQCKIQVFFFLVNELKERALVRYNSIKGQEVEQLVSGSDDFTLFLWQPGESKKPIARMTGEEGVVQR